MRLGFLRLSEAMADINMVCDAKDEVKEMEEEMAAAEDETKKDEKKDDEVAAAEDETKNDEKKDDEVNEIVKQWSSCVWWMKACSAHLSNIEKRLMEAEYLGHEVVRQITMLLTSFSPAPRGDWGWLWRQALDIGVRTMRQLVKSYLRHEAKDEFMARAYKMVRLFFEEGWRRALMGCKNNMMRPAGP